MPSAQTPAPAPHQAAPAPQPLCAALWLATVVLVTLNLRPFLTAVGPLSAPIQSTTGMGLSALSWLTLLPMALMGLGAWLAPAALDRLGPRRAVAGALAVLALGCALRAGGAHGLLLLTTSALCGAGVALIQGVLPGLIKRRSPTRVAQMMGVYSAALMGGGALGAQLSPLAVQWGLDWRLALALWALPALLAMALARHALRGLPQPVAGRAAGGTAWLRRRPRTWLLMACFGLVNGGYAALVAWLAPFYQSHGWSAAHSGSLVALLSVAQAGAALALPVLAAGHADRRPWLGLALLCQIAGLAALAWWPDAAPLLSTVILGIGLGGCFALMMVVALDHLPDPAQAGALNAQMQGGGFLIAALAPLVIARLHQATGSFQAGWLAQLGAVLVVCVLATRFAPRRYAQVMRAPGP